MDGNGRWAKKRGLPRKAGHAFGYRAMFKVIKRCIDLGIKHVSLYAFSTENWKRPEDEINAMFELVRHGFDRDFDALIKGGVRITTMGDVSKFPQDIQDKLSEVRDKTKRNDVLTLVMCVNYGGRDEILRAVKKSKGDVSEFEKNLDSKGIPDPDLIVRTSGEQRISNFMLWQMAYSEFLFIPEHWPQMNHKLVDRCIIDYQKRDRRYGKIKEPK